MTKSETQHFYLIYLSQCAQDISELTLLNIMTKSFNNNKIDDITSMLIHRPSQFLQVLEGEKAVIDRTFARIQNDNRHFAIRLIDSGYKTQHYSREFMGFRHMESRYRKAFSFLFQNGFDDKFLSEHKQATHMFLINIGQKQPYSEQSKAYQHYKYVD